MLDCLFPQVTLPFQERAEKFHSLCGERNEFIPGEWRGYRLEHGALACWNALNEKLLEISYTPGNGEDPQFTVYNLDGSREHPSDPNLDHVLVALKHAKELSREEWVRATLPPNASLRIALSLFGPNSE